MIVHVALDVVELLGQIEDIGRDLVRGGYSRHVYDGAELALREWSRRTCAGLGLELETDRNGNLWAHWGARGPGMIAIGSHLDSVPGGGAYDGPLGVAAALAAVSRLQEDGFVPTHPVAVVAFGEEEGSRFGIACLGSKLMVGTVAGPTVAALTDVSGVSYRNACAADGLDADGLGRDEDRIASLAAFVELHVEQGRGLIDLDAPVAVASAIRGPRALEAGLLRGGQPCRGHPDVGSSRSRRSHGRSRAGDPAHRDRARRSRA